MKQHVAKTALLLFTFLAATAPDVPAQAAENVGVERVQVYSETRNEDLSVVIWYPAGPGGSPVAVGENRIFKGTPAYAKAPRTEGAFPLIVLSHGSGATVEKMAWIATALAQDGFVVAGPNHPGTATGDSTPEDTPKLWQRTDDLSALLDFLLADPDWQAAVDPDRIGLLGFSLGGATVLRSVGATAKLDTYAQYCQTYPAMADCRWYAGGKAYRDGAEIAVAPFDLRSLDRESFERPERDLRVRAVVAVDPGLAAAFELPSLEEIGMPLHFINLGEPETVPISVKSDHLAGHAPRGSIDYVAGAVHFSFLPECKADAEDFLKRIGETDALCSDGGTRSRAALHGDLRDMIPAVFSQAFGTGH